MSRDKSHDISRDKSSEKLRDKSGDKSCDKSRVIMSRDKSRDLSLNKLTILHSYSGQLGDHCRNDFLLADPDSGHKLITFHTFSCNIDILVQVSNKKYKFMLNHVNVLM